MTSPNDDQDRRSLIDLLVDDQAAGPIQAALRGLLDELTPTELDVLSRRFGLDDDGVMILSRERIRQLHDRALAELRTGLRKLRDDSSNGKEEED